ncbi:hypothetical protein DACRYDRAFT_23794 [Dacryopinax primogenitus]|uniref:Uncharacterized protein n=1 Tax=Dacryopinax primogenitus (strain DJM 731) TaxID=1858805 RepID=M5G5Z8_DACPD|nr:uncharacterized protein DACRYDRAFT_23794 [Dacryopinax primogenitus]EJT99177.1 hypothetical protein DACRYDRAFT_23794 [Dacryopinax primogenitus]
MGANLAFDPFRKARDDEPVKLLWRERLEQRCKDRVANDRRKSRDRERGLDTAADQDMEESEIDFLDDELIRRAVVADARRKQRDLELVYARDVGSSIDPDMEDVDALEREILAAAQEPDSEPSPPSSVLMDDDGDPGDLFDAYLAQLTEEERTSSLPPSSPPTIPSSPPPLSDDFDMDDWDTEFALDD